MKEILKIINRVKWLIKLTWYKVKYMTCISKVEEILNNTMPQNHIVSSKEIITMLCANGLDPFVIAGLVIKNYHFNLVSSKFPSGLSDEEKELILEILNTSVSIDEIVEAINKRRSGNKNIIDDYKKTIFKK